MQKIILGFLISATVVFSLSIAAKTVEGVDFVETYTVGDKTLKLNGAGLRKVHRFGIPVKVYVGGLYLETASRSSTEIIASPQIKVLKMVFVRVVDKKDLVKAWQEGFANNCDPKDCDAARPGLKEFNSKMVDSKNKGSMTLRFMPDHVTYEIDGRTKVEGRIEGEAFSRSLLSVFIGPKPPTPEFKSSLMGH